MARLAPRVATVAAMAGVALIAFAGLGPVDHRRAVVSSIGGGALIAAIGLGVVLTYRSSGVVNFANAAMATYGAYTFTVLRRDGRLFLPPLPNPLALIEGLAHAFGARSVQLPNIPTAIDLGGPLNIGAAFAITLAVAALLGLAMHALVFRPLRHAPPLAKTVASVGLLLILQAAVVLRFSSQTVAVRPVFDKRPLHLLGTTVGRDQLVLGAIVVLVTAALWAVFRFTRFGLATRAASEDEKGAVLIGLSPERLAAVNWVLSAVLAASFGVLAATVNASIDPATITFLIIPALGAALLGGLASFGITVAAAFAIAGLQSVVQYVAATATWFPKAHGAPLPGVREALPLVVILVVLFLRGDRLPTRGSLQTGRLPAAPVTARATPAAVTALVGGAILLVLVGPDWRLAAINSLVGIVLCLSLVILTGFVGQISLAQMAFAGISGFTIAKLATTWGIGFPWAPLLGALVASAIGVIAAIPALRVRGVNLAIVTLAAAATVENLVFKNSSLTGGLNGAHVGPPRLPGLRFGPNDASSLGDGKLPSPLFAIFCLVVAVGLAVLIVNMRRSPTGRRLLAVRTNERAAAAGGINVAGTKLLAFWLSSFVAGVGGALSAYRFGSVTAATFGTFASITFLAFAYLGGISTVAGAVIGGLLVAGGIAVTAMQHVFGIDPSYTTLLGGIGLVLTAVLHPEGIAGTLPALRGAIGSRVRRRAEAPLPVPTVPAVPAAVRLVDEGVGVG